MRTCAAVQDLVRLLVVVDKGRLGLGDFRPLAPLCVVALNDLFVPFQSVAMCEFEFNFFTGCADWQRNLTAAAAAASCRCWAA